MQLDSSSPSFLTAVDSSQHHGSTAEQGPSASRASVQSLAVAFPGAYPSSISLVSIDTRQSTPPLVSSSDPHFPSPIHDPPRLRTPSVSSSATGVGALNMDPYVPPPQPYPQPPPPPRPRTPNIPRESLIRRIVAFFGYGSGTKARRHLISFLWTALLDGLQIVFSIVLLSLARATTSPTEPGLSEWDACGKPLGTWDAIWILRTALDFGLAYYHWSRQRRPNLVNADVERAHHQQAEILAPPRDVHDRPEQDGRGNRRENPAHAYPALYSRLSAFCTMFTIVWFVMAHIFLFTSADTCRFSSPYIWWLSFAILSIMYFAVGEVILIAIVVFIIGPLLALLYAIIMLLLGRHPLRPLNYMEPDIRALPQNLVDKIPLVIYIPSPPDEPSSGPVTIPPEALVYPPKPRPGPTFIKKPRFRWLRAKKKAAKGENKDDEVDPEKDPEKEDGMETDGQRQAWEDNWERGDYPFVRLEDNRATCAICLLDFEEPPRKPNANPGDVVEPIVEEANADPAGEASVQAPAMEPNPAGLRLEDAEEGDQILRLLACGHVFHQSCVDPWLTGVSGRCPTCQCKVEIPRERRKRWRYGRRRRPDPPPPAP